MYLEAPDSLSQLLKRLDLAAEVYVNGDFCGAWAVDTSGSRKIPFHLIGGGEAWLHIEGEPPKLLTTGSLVMFPRDQQHVMSGSKIIPSQEQLAEPDLDGSAMTNMVCGFFEFQNKLVWPLLDSLSDVVVLDLRDISTQPVIKTYVDLMIAELQQEKAGHYAVINQLAYLLFVQILRQQIEMGQIKTGLLAALFDEKIGKALNAIHANPGLQWTLESLAELCLMSRSGFAKHFNDLVGLPAMQYLTQWRMQEATLLLEQTSLSMLEIAERCGYESEPAFRKAFKKVVGTNAAAVRKQAKP